MEGKRPLSSGPVTSTASATSSAGASGGGTATELQFVGGEEPKSGNSTGLSSPMTQPSTPDTPVTPGGGVELQGSGSGVGGSSISGGDSSPMEVMGEGLIRSGVASSSGVIRGAGGDGTGGTSVLNLNTGGGGGDPGRSPAAVVQSLLGTAAGATTESRPESQQRVPSSAAAQVATAATTGSGTASSSSSALRGDVLRGEVPVQKKVELEIAPTTGGSFNFVIDPEESIEGLKKAIGKKLKVGKEHICLLHRDRLLESSKTIRDYGLADGSRVSLVPSVETGLLTQRPEQSVLEALEGLNETQVGDFLSGKSPLNLTMRLGDHVMLIQLQLSKGSKGHSSSSSSSSTTAGASSTSTTAVPSSSSSSTSSTASTSTSNSNPVSSSTRTATTTSTTIPSAPSSAVPNQPATPSQIPTASTSNQRPSSSRSSSSSTASQPPPQQQYEHDRLNTLAEASRNLSNTLKKLSSHVIKEDDDSITNHMQHHGKGVYSGTFSGTLNPALQDGLGKPKKHVSTIIHILNDLLGGMDPTKCAHLTAATTSSSGSGTSSTTTPPTTSPLSPGSSLSTDLHNKRRQLRRRQPENPGQGHHGGHHHHSSRKGEESMKRQRFMHGHHHHHNHAPSSSASSPGTDWSPASPDSDHQYHRCLNSQRPSSCSTSGAPGSTSPVVNRERENEQLRLKMERLKESLRLRKEKMMMRSSRATAAAAQQAASGQPTTPSPAPPAPTAAS